MNLLVSDVHKSFAQGGRSIDVLRGVQLEASEGNQVAVLGRSGSGKSTLLSLLAGLDLTDRGEISINHSSLSALSLTELAAFRARNVGIIFQQFHLMSDLTALENVALPLELTREKNAASRARVALEQVGLSDRAGHYARQLSGGECQRVAFARAIVHRPTLLLADEPTGNLDHATAIEITDLLFRLAGETRAILILVTHSEAMADRCQRKYRLEQGQLRA